MLKGSMNTEENVTTIWLLSTLGNPRSAVGQSSVVSVGSTVVKKRDILGVSIPSTCNAIQKNETRLPLRQISNLLYGVILCYNKKTEYVLSDLTAILMQLSRQKQHRFAASRKHRNARVLNGSTENQLEGLNMHANIEELLLEDDPTFDVHYMADCSVFDLEALGDAKASHEDALVIRRQDYMNELSNSERTDNSKMMPNSTSGYRSLISTIEEIPIDIDFNLDIDELEGQHGTTASSGSLLGEHSPANLDRLDDANTTFTNLDLEIGDNNNDNLITSEERYNNADNGVQAADDGPENKSNPHRKPGEMGGLSKKARVSKATDQQILGRIKCDERIGIQTSTLRFTNENYGQLMQQKSGRQVSHPGRNRGWKDSFLGKDSQIGGVSTPIPILTKAWNFLFDILSNYEEGVEEVGFLDDRSAERGRQRHRTSSGSWSHGTESIRSEEQGRRQRYLRDSIDIFGMDENNQNESFNNNNSNTANMLLHLDQIDEELEGANTLGELNRYYQSEPMEVPSSQDFLRVDLRLPPSSFDKSDSLPRAFSKRNTEEVEDVIDTLRSRAPQRSYSGFGNRTNIPSVDNVRNESASEAATSDILGNKVLDHQSMKFYDYIKEKALFLGVETQSDYPFQRTLFFEDLLPGGSSNNEPPPISRRVVAGAFLTVLNLASKGMLAIKEDGEAEQQPATKFSTLTGRDIVLCV